MSEFNIVHIQEINMIIYRDGFPIPPKFDAITIGTYIFARPSVRLQKGIIEHEKVHVRQFKKEPIIFWFKYLFSKKYRFEYESEAYATSIRNGMEIEVAVNILRTKYKLNVTREHCLDTILKYLNR